MLVMLSALDDYDFSLAKPKLLPGCTGVKYDSNIMLIRQFRSHIRHVVLGLVFLWFVNLAFIRRYGISLQRINPRRSWGTDVCGFPQPINYSEPHGCILQSPVDPDAKAEGVKRPCNQCNYFTENFVRAYCCVEEDTHAVVRRLVTPSDVVLEVGARYGTTSCELAAAMNNTGALISVEPDHVVWAAAEFNKMSHNCRGYSVLGVLGDEDVWMEGYKDEEQMGEAERKSYNKMTKKDGMEHAEMVRIKHYTWDYLEKETRLRVNTVIIDCEGCWVEFIIKHEDKFRNQIEKIVLENDHDNKTVSAMGLERLKSWGFKEDKELSPGHLDWLGSILVFTK